MDGIETKSIMNNVFIKCGKRALCTFIISKAIPINTFEKKSLKPFYLF